MVNESNSVNMSLLVFPQKTLRYPQKIKNENVLYEVRKVDNDMV